MVVPVRVATGWELRVDCKGKSVYNTQYQTFHGMNTMELTVSSSSLRAHIENTFPASVLALVESLTQSTHSKLNWTNEI